MTIAAVPMAQAATYHHKRYVGDYEGTRTCLECHQEEAENFFHSQHYQWRGQTPDVVNSDGATLGKMIMVNDFCTNPDGSQWIGKVENVGGTVLAKGCSKCHAGFGKKPTSEISQEQLENIDCLICHASGYRRDLYATEDGGWEWKPILWKNKEGMNSVASRISQPKRTMCLRCHAASGGGPNYKRGDIEYTLNDPPREFDVHMATEGTDMACSDCHAGEDHKVRGRGVDLAATDSPERLTCAGDCHAANPHGDEDLDGHTDRLACQTCHIPTFARDEPTDMRRDWSNPQWVEETGKWTYDKTMEQNVVPVYAWFNGKSWLQIPGKKVQYNENGEVMMNQPQGSRDNPDARIYPFKLHRGMLPVLNKQQWISPLTTEEFYGHGDSDKAVREAAGPYYGLEHDEIDYTWKETVRYMSINHEVVPMDAALKCRDCHSTRRQGRMDWQALGYEGDPSKK